MVTQGGSEQVGIQSGLCFRKITRAMACGMRTPRLNVCEASVKDGTEEGLTGSQQSLSKREGQRECHQHPLPVPWALPQLPARAHASCLPFINSTHRTGRTIMRRKE